MRRFVRWFAVFLAVVIVLLCALSLRAVPAHIEYGVSFSTLQADQLGLDWKTTYRAVLDDLGVRKLRLAAYWPMVEPERDRYSWSDLDFQLSEARARKADVILSVGRRLPRWPECHVPEWAQKLSWEEQKDELRSYLTAVVGRYKDDPGITYWQVENEPFLEVFAYDHCGDLDRAFLAEEIALVRSLDSRPILVTDSGNLGTWAGAYRSADAFGTSVYVYFWNPELGQFKTVLPPAFYRIKENVARLLFGAKPVFLIELSLEPWLVEPTAGAPLEDQLSRMDLQKFNEVVEYARDTRFGTQYLWGAEWWYYMKGQGHPEFWNAAKELYSK